MAALDHVGSAKRRSSRTFAVVLFKRPIGAGIALAALMIFMYPPMSYYTDRFLYNRRQRQKQDLLTAIGLAVAAFLIYVPLGYKVDRMFWERRMRKAGRPIPPRRSPAAKGKR